MASLWTLHCRFNFIEPSVWIARHHNLTSRTEIKWKSNNYTGRLNAKRKFKLRAAHDSLSPTPSPSSLLPLNPSDDQDKLQDKDDDALPLLSSSIETKKDSKLITLKETIISLPPVVFMLKQRAGSKWAIGLCIAAAVLGIAVRAFVVRKSNSQQRPGSVSDLVRRGQLRSDRRGMSSPLKYEDPFNNPMVKIDKGNSTVEMCGKVYRLAPITLTEEEQATHQKRRSRAYQWRRPTVFLKEGDPVPDDVDPDTIRWIPSNHPFATTASDIDEDLAQNNVYQKHGVPFRIQAEHEALQKKFEALQNEQKLNKLVIDGSAAKDFERSFKMNSQLQEPIEQNPFRNQAADSKPPKLDDNTTGSSSSSEETERP